MEMFYMRSRLLLQLILFLVVRSQSIYPYWLNHEISLPEFYNVRKLVQNEKTRIIH